MIDLHVHTTCSDGQLTEKQILDKSNEIGLTAISFCDHNVLGAYQILDKMDSSKFRTRIITGIEFDFVFNHKDFHMLGYDFDWKMMNKNNLINTKSEEEIIQEENKKLAFLKEVCRKQGIKFDEGLIISRKNDKASTIMKYHMMEFKENDAILDEMLGKNRDKSFARGYVHNPNSPFFIDETIGLPTAIDVANLIHSCGGKVVLAHPFDYKDINHKQYIQDIYNLGILDGIECLHTRHGIEQIEYIKNFCLKNNLLITGGSDFHREQKQTLGYGANGTIPITEEYCLKNYTQIEVHER